MSKSRNSGSSRFLRGIVILHEDRDIIVIDKPAGLLSIGKRGENRPNALSILTRYVRKGSSNSHRPVHIVHRLDRETSGVLIFAKSRLAQEILQKNWKDVKKKYLAVVHGTMEKKTGKISSYLAENKNLVVFSTNDPKLGKLSHTTYKVLREAKRYSLLEINLLTGRKNQIRVHMAEAGHPIAGDKKYGRSDKRLRRMALHAKSISFNHPYNNKRLFFETETPNIFEDLTRQADKAAPSSSNRNGHAEKKKSSRTQKTRPGSRR